MSLRSFSANRLRLAARASTIWNRSNYKDTWNRLARNYESAKRNVGGSVDEAELDRTGLYTADLLDRFVRIGPADVVLEIGCGVARVGKLLAPRCRTWIGADVSRHMLAHARRRLGTLPNVQLVELTGHGLDGLEDDSIDVVYCTVVFMHLLEWDRYRYILDAFRVLRPGGRCFFDNADITSTHGWDLFMQSFRVAPGERAPNLSMVSSGDELLTYASRAGFGHVQVHRWDDAWVGVVGTKPEPPRAT